MIFRSLKHITRTFLFISLLSLVLACQPNNKPTNHKQFTVELDLFKEPNAEEYIDNTNPIEENRQLTYSINDILALQIYSRTISSNAKYAPYAYAIYSDLAQKIIIPMTEGQEYKIEATLIKDGSTLIQRNNQSNFLSPLIVNGTCFMSQIEHNQINVSRDCVMQGLGKSSSSMASDRKSYNRPLLDRYHGIINGFDPRQSQKLTLKLNRVVFGIQINTENQIEGTINVLLAQAPSLTIDSSTDPTTTYIFSMTNSIIDETAWIQDAYSENIEVKTIWNKPNGEIINLPTRTLTFKRKHYYKLNIKLSDIQHDTNPNIELEDDTLILGGNITID